MYFMEAVACSTLTLHEQLHEFLLHESLCHPVYSCMHEQDSEQMVSLSLVAVQSLLF